MKIKIQLKDPDGVYNAIRDAVNAEVSAIVGLDEDEVEDICDSRHQDTQDDLKPWIKYGEYVTIEIDTDEGTAIVCKV